MNTFLLELGTRIKNFFKEKVNLIIALLLIGILLQIYTYVEILDSNFHFYMNTKTSLEHIQNTIQGKQNFKFDIYDGKPEKQLSTEELLVRKNNRKFHLYYLLKNIGF